MVFVFHDSNELSQHYELHFSPPIPSNRGSSPAHSPSNADLDAHQAQRRSANDVVHARDVVPASYRALDDAEEPECAEDGAEPRSRCTCSHLVKVGICSIAAGNSQIDGQKPNQPPMVSQMELEQTKPARAISRRIIVRCLKVDKRCPKWLSDLLLRCREGESSYGREGDSRKIERWKTLNAGRWTTGFK